MQSLHKKNNMHNFILILYDKKKHSGSQFSSLERIKLKNRKEKNKGSIYSGKSCLFNIVDTKVALHREVSINTQTSIKFISTNRSCHTGLRMQAGTHELWKVCLHLKMNTMDVWAPDTRLQNCIYSSQLKLLTQCICQKKMFLTEHRRQLYYQIKRINTVQGQSWE